METATPASPVGDPSAEAGEVDMPTPAAPKPGSAEKTENPPAESIDGCDSSTCSVADAVKYEHPTQGPVTVALFADFTETEAGDCKIAVFDGGDRTVQLLPFEYLTAWNMRDEALAEIFYFMEPPVDSTSNIFLRIPDHDGFVASGLRPVSTGYFELFDLSYVPEDFSEVFNSEPMVGVEWGEIDNDGNYTLEIAGEVAVWNGKKYVAQ
ncbi:hypothetical protein [Brevibacterium sp.]|uniref:hypothetical protein n=1 Tax=Brevibacterium sp. TaxID=1701 RepID=UPI002810E305|nr:hypothetical protein [Brevibacterium sp.]